MRFKTSDLYSELIGRRAPLRGLVSLVELNLTAADVCRLRTWACDTARPIEAKAMRERFGLVFLAAATAVARDEAGEGTLWPHLVEVFGCGDGKTFKGPKQLHPDVQDSILAAARAFGLRHALSRDTDEQRWYLTVLLQCGWTRPGIDKHLASWLAGHPVPKSVQLLLEDPELRSESFRALFEDLLRFRRGERDSVPDSPWLTGDLYGLAVNRARADAHLGTSTGGRAAACGVRLLLPPQGMPRFLLDLAPSFAQDSGSPTLLVRAGSSQVRAYLDADGGYRTDGQLEVEVADDMSEVELAISTPSGEILAQELVLLYGEEDVDLFVELEENHYRRVPDAWTAKAPVRRGVLIRVADDLMIEGTFDRPPIRGGGSVWQALRADEIHQPRVRIGDVIWDLPDDGRPRRHWPHPVTVKWEDDGAWISGKTVTWRCDVGHVGAVVARAWVGRQPLRIERKKEGPSMLGQMLILDRPKALPKSFRLRLQIKHEGPPYLRYHEAEPPFCSRPLRRGSDGLSTIGRMCWEELQPPILCFGRTTGEHAGSQPYLFEGERAVAPLFPKETMIARRLAGLGGRVTIRTGRFNGETCGRPRPEDHVVNTGPLRGVESTEPGIVLVRMAHHLEWTAADVGIELMARDGTVHAIDSTLLEVAPGAIQALWEFQPVAVATAFQGVFVGRWLTPGAGDTILAACSSQDAFFSIALWLLKRRFPVEGPDLKPILGQLSARHVIEALRVCLDREIAEDDCLAGAWRFVLSSSYDQMFDALCQTQDGVGQLLTHVVVSGSAHPVVEIYKRLAAVDPMAASIFLLVALVQRQHERSSTDPHGCENELYRFGESPDVDIRRASRRLDVDEGTFTTLLDRVARGSFDPRKNDRDRNELLRYCYIPEFREALARAFVRPALRAWRTLCGQR